MKSYAQWLLRHRRWVIAITLLITAVLGVFGAGLKVIIDPVTLAPQGHPYIKATNRVDEVFGSKYMMLIGITPREGDIFQPAVLERVERITRKLETTPGVVRSSLVSLAARQAKGIKGTAEGFEARPLLSGTTLSPADIEALKATIKSNPVYLNTVVAPDYRTAVIMLELKERSDGFHNMVEPVRQVVDAEIGPEVEIRMGGNPVYLDKTEAFAERINLLFPIAIVVIGLLHFEAFRTKQGLILPLVTAVMAVAWGMGFMGLLGQPLDIFNSPTPILILAVAAGHAVQLLKRYYEEYAELRRTTQLTPKEANQEAVIRSLAGVGPVMLIAGGVAALGFFSLLVFNIQTIRAFGVFTGAGILSAALLEMTFIPAVRSMLKPPSDKDVALESRVRIWDRMVNGVAGLLLQPGRRRAMYAALAVTALVFVLGIQKVVIDNSSKRYFASDLPLQVDDEYLNQATGGTNSLYIMVEGDKADAMKSPQVLAAIERVQRFAETQPEVGKTISIVDYLKRMNQAMNGDAASANVLPSNGELVSQYLLLYSMSGEPEDFNAYVDYDYQRAKITLLLKTGSNQVVKGLVSKLEQETRAAFGSDVRVSFGGDVTQTIALTETMVNGKLRNIVQIALAIFVISALAFRSLVAGVIVLMPLAMAVLAVFGVMGLFGIPLNIPNSLISAMAVGIGADYAIYLLFRMREQVRAGADANAALKKTMATAGKAALYVATAVAGGYGVLALSIGYNVHLWLSMFIVLAMVVSVWASLTLVPGLVLSWRPRFIFSTNAQRPLWSLLALLLAGSAAVLFVARAQAQTPSAADLVEKSLTATKVKDSDANATFTLTNRDGASRVRKTRGLTKLQDNGQDNMRLVRFLSPADIKGTATLLVEHAGADDDMWIYLPALGKVRRLSASNKRDSFVGTDFSYGDIIGHKTAEWRHALLREEAVDGAPAYVIESVPLNDTVKNNTGYAKRVSWVRKDNFVASRIDFWDVAGQPLKRITASDIRPVGNGKFQAMDSVAENLQTGHRTTIHFDDFKADLGLKADLFATGRLEQ
ncbi:outer membrane lipoprotein-sorting protein [Azohydromonas caseinilytica]|uniref:outer membrane lipoprotein-sorting protein n=1 Tax=Azohydromonas caseinilytica TaxID=2728836 RepID=UPI00197B6FEB|nr:outer membrane lipoprotein-sorting protein [Azohydromonas caseinilytica]